ncbi:BolA family transcriptional regulator [Oceanimonas sp. NS1]|uniref:Cell division protein BolA n=1 Tax=Oceanimonas doudoroffii TaxID=84158 RepID=A0A233RCR9_9GAMM|nr:MULTISPECIES: BolA family protein [Oceanimonas]MCT7654898.1 BolA family transcriptional regulator [Oceanimonas sp. NS1]NHI01170.1 Acid stress protein IbaG [Oceanimonas sp. MB9]OXY81183.1 cell division protein BolA [Oceanimonas doudoroffii]
MDLNNEVERRLRDALELDELYVKSEGDHFQVIAVSGIFADMSRVKRQQAINGPLMDLIAQNAIHALSVKTFTPEQWARERKFIMPS